MSLSHINVLHALRLGNSSSFFTHHRRHHQYHHHHRHQHIHHPFIYIFTFIFILISSYPPLLALLPSSLFLCIMSHQFLSQGYSQCNAYIATQTPLPDTVNDFWKMVFEKKATVIVMLNNLTEGKTVIFTFRLKCVL